jgi:septum formation protein
MIMDLDEAKEEVIISKIANLKDGEIISEPLLLITADQVVVHEGIIREKPSNEKEARLFIKGYSI